MRSLLVLSALTLGCAAQAVTLEELVKELELTPKADAPLCKALAQTYPVTGYTVPSPMAVVKYANLRMVNAQLVIPGGVGSLAPYKDQKWQLLGSGFSTLDINDKDRKGFQLWFDEVDRYHTDICIRDLTK